MCNCPSHYNLHRSYSSCYSFHFSIDCFNKSLSLINNLLRQFFQHNTIHHVYYYRYTQNIKQQNYANECVIHSFLLSLSDYIQIHNIQQIVFQVDSKRLQKLNKHLLWEVLLMLSLSSKS